MRRIYLDNCATTKLAPEVIEAMHKAEPIFGNPSSIHSAGNEAKSIIDESRKTVAEFLNCDETEVVFTSGGSESDNLAIRGIIGQITNNQETITRKNSNSNIQTTDTVIPAKAGIQDENWIPDQVRDDNIVLPHVITSAIEHHAVLHTVQELEKEGKIEATYIKPNAEGIVSAQSVIDAIKPNTVLVSVMYVNNETGTRNPIKEIGVAIRNKELGTGNKGNENSPSSLVPRPYFHTDAVQAAGYLSMNVKELGVDLLTFTGHKIHGPKGVGVLFIKNGTPISPQITGGGHEFGKRAGTENVVGISGLAAAVERITSSSVIPAKAGIQNNATGSQIKSGMTSNDRLPRFARNDKHTMVKTLRDKLENYILKNISDTRLNGSKEERIPSVTNISFKNAEGESILLNLDMLGVAVSSGSACTSQSLAPSHVLTAMDVPVEYTHGSIRFSLSEETSEEEIDRVCEMLPGIISKLRLMSPIK